MMAVINNEKQGRQLTLVLCVMCGVGYDWSRVILLANIPADLDLGTGDDLHLHVLGSIGSVV